MNSNGSVNKVLLVVVVAFVLLLGLVFMNNNTPSSKTDKQLTQSESQVKLLEPSEFKELIADEKVFVLDVHTPEQTHIPGTDAVIPYNQLSDNLGKLPEDKSTPIAVYCRSGGMSAQASKELVALGYSNVYDLAGGANAYKKQEQSVSLLPKTIDLGTVVYGDVATTEFSLTNFSDKPVEITRVSTSCGCTKASVETKKLAPYETTLVKVSFDPAVHKDDTDLGELSRTIYIKTDNPDFPELEAVITANVIKK